MVFIQNSNYLQLLAKFGVGGAHPGGINLSKEIMKNESILPASHILDVGCGTGQTAAFLASHYAAHVTGIDINPIMIEKARHRMKKGHLSVNVIQGSIEETTLPNEAFDFVLAESVLAFVNKQRALQEIFRLLKKGGRLIAIEFTVPMLLSTLQADDIQQFYGFDALLTKKDWVALFQETGFQDIRIQKNKDISSKPEFHISKDIESTLYDVMDQHLRMNEKYDTILDYRIYICTK
ncbi:class I SAM-dependent methyltransferase [Lysinibacillus fusiformis]|uniref:class I SAM-dependent methyltransferase n=1 Tax=Lysinibacillus fusiformis TaxID=28031 RepID=UPI001F4E5A0B|nr:class I SAM-dependent methyltransferase [Lysinibacillus fusiformis]MCK1987648.1 methyltransferase domain-containing protein [Lysinibacillus fusiformis]MDC6266295.1 class I SAM-dependent methyltransferase [Lysinibacillus sphaericus]MDN4970169.1 class I SAM-dependent methyltransferase [Lysinibacillus fusiformis]UXJ70575.1 methyltransferase domain-containing protein [Lysinibacillus fusiformis]